jgi:hypothetical protein
MTTKPPEAPTAAAPAATPSPMPAVPPHLPHFEPVARPPPPAPVLPAATDGPTLPENEWITIATKRRGNPELASLGWTLVLLGLAVLAATYYWGVAYGNLFAPAGIRGDLIGGVLVLLGLIIGLLFLLLPRNKAAGLGPDASVQQIEDLVRYTNGQVLLSQILAGIGVGLAMVGLIWMTYWLRLSYLEDTELRTSLGGSDLATYFIGVPLIVLGLFVLFYFVGRLSAARRSRNVAVLLMVRMHQGAPALTSNAMLSTGVAEQEVQDLMKRLDGLMAQLPDAAVTEFSKTKEADTYLKLLGS